MAKKKKNIKSWHYYLGWLLIATGVLSIFIFSIRLYQLWDLFQYFEEIGRVRSGSQSWYLRGVEDGLIVLFQLTLGNYLRVESKKASQSFVFVSLILAAYVLYRLAEEIFIISQLI